MKCMPRISHLFQLNIFRIGKETVVIFEKRCFPSLEVNLLEVINGIPCSHCHEMKMGMLWCKMKHNVMVGLQVTGLLGGRHFHQIIDQLVCRQFGLKLLVWLAPWQSNSLVK